MQGLGTEGLARVLQCLSTGGLAGDLVPDVDELVDAPFLLTADHLGTDRPHHRCAFHQLQFCRSSLAHQRHRQILIAFHLMHSLFG